jgi:transcriptional regulator GlxA family with amidase domain
LETNHRGLVQRALSDPARRPDGEAAVSSACQSEGARKVAQSIAYLLEHLGQPLPVATLAERTRVSPSQCFVLFKRRTGCPPMDHFIRLRMQRARELLDATPARVKEIAADPGYKDPFYFSRVFKSVTWAAPTRNRARQRASLPAGELPPAGRLPELSGQISGNFNSASRFNGAFNHQHQSYQLL